MEIIHYEKDFTSLIEKRAVVDFFADWCGPCKMFAPIFEETAINKNFNFVKVNTDSYPDLAREYGVMSIPTVILFENGHEVKRHTGFMSKEEFLNFLD